MIAHISHRYARSIMPDPTMPTSHPAEIVLIDGPDAVAFAQSQFSSNVTSLANGHWQFSAWLDAQGRVRTLFHLARLNDEHLVLLLRGGNAATMADALRRFVFRSRVSLDAPASWMLGTGPSQPLNTVDTNSSTVRLGCDTHSMLLGTNVISDEAWRQPQLHSGWPWLPSTALDELLPPALSLHRLQAVAIDKGCYPGQEIVARMHYRGGHKRHMHHVLLSQHVDAGAVLRHGDRELARVLDVTTHENNVVEALVVMQDDVASQVAQGVANVTDDGIRIDLRTSWPA